ncbi:MAG: thiol reductant ABC exporter subunit CydC [Ktedonobacterales bacterium]
MADATSVKGPYTFLRLLRPLARLQWRVALAVLLGVIMIASNIGLLGMAAYLISASALQPLLVVLTLPIYIVRVAGVVRALSRYSERVASHSLTLRLLARVRAQTFRRLALLAPSQLSAYRSGDLLTRLVADVDEFQHLYLRVVGPFLVAGVIAILTSGLFALFSDVLAWTALAFLVVAGIAVPLLAAKLSRHLGERRLAVRGELNAQLVDSIQGVQDVLAFGLEHEFRQRVARLDGERTRVQQQMAAIGAVEAGLGSMVSSLAIWTILLLSIPLASAHQIGGIYLAFLALVMLASFEAVQPLGSALQYLGHTLAAGRRVFAVLDSTPEIPDRADPLPLPGGAVQTAADVTSMHRQPLALTFEHVTFAYDPDAEPALSDVSFTVPAGSHIAIVGPSGAGKSTLARLAVRFADPSCGAVLLGGTDVRRYALHDLRAVIGVIPQETHIFNDTLRRNLLLARPEATDAELEQALKQAQFDDVLRLLPGGLDTWVGENGQRLSGGERQRLSVARALLHDAPLLILDEPTANLDAVTEHELLRTFETAARGRTTLLITHRLYAMERMDMIFVLDHGRIVERGTHARLLASGGLYRHLFDVQCDMLAPVPDRIDPMEALHG